MKNILLVEDDQIQSEYIGALLESLGCFVFKAANEVEAIEYIKQDLADFHIIISDIRMSEATSGFEVLKCALANKKTKDTPFVFLSGKTDVETVLNAIGSGASDYILKPIDPETFIAKIKNLINEETDKQLTTRHYGAV